MVEVGTSLALAFVVIGIIMLVAEATSPGTFIIVPATVLLVLGGIGLVYPDILVSWWSPLIAVVVLFPVTMLTIKMYQKLAPPAPPETTVGTSLVGLTGRVVAAVEPGTLKGKVRISHDTWSASSEAPIPVGTKVLVLRSEGVHVIVEEINK